MQGHDPSPLIFVVDDDTSIVRTLEGLLGRAGFRTAAAGSVAGALRGISEQHPDLILLDVHLPDGTGFDICSSVHDELKTSSTPILFISAADDTSTKIRGFEAGGVDYITKPIVGAEVIARVRTHLRLKRAYDRIAELQAGHVGQLASAQKTLMASPEDFPEACFAVSIRQVLSAGGDFYDVIATGEDIADYLVADASGHDLGASLWTASLKALAAEYAGPMHLPLEIVRAINNCLCRILPSGAFFTLVYARLNRRTGRISIVNAGHPPPIVVRIDAGEPLILRQEGDVVGAFADAVFGVAEMTLKKGERIFFYTDGLIEGRGSYEEGLGRLAGACYARRSLALDDLVPFVAEEAMADLPATDDTLLVGVER